MRKSSAWLEYEKLAARIYSELQPYARVMHDDQVMGQDSGRLRQIDVSIRTNVAGHEILLIVQVRKRGRRVDVNAVGEFASVVKDVRASKGVMVCNAGFSKTALRLAHSYNIDLCTLHDAQSANWPLSLSLPILWIENTLNIRVEMVLRPIVPSMESIVLPQEAHQWTFSDDGGHTLYHVFKDLTQQWNRGQIPRAENSIETFVPDSSSLFLLIAPNTWCQLETFVIQYRLIRRAWLGTVPLADCRGIMNRSVDTFTAHIALTNRDIPFLRNPAWIPVEKPNEIEANAYDLIVVECPEISEDSLLFSHMDLEAV